MLGLQSLVAIGQFALQKSLFGYWFLGETNLLHFAGIASQTIGGQEFILPSGTTPHPNVLAGVLLIGSVVLWQRRKDIPRWLLLSTLAVSLFGIGVTFSLSAWLAGMFALGFYGVKSQLDTTHKRIVLAGVWSLIVLIPLVMSQFSVVSANPSLTRRSTLNQVAITTFAAQPLWGTGLNTFTRGLALTNTHRIRAVCATGAPCPAFVTGGNWLVWRTCRSGNLDLATKEQQQPRCDTARQLCTCATHQS